MNYYEAQELLEAVKYGRPTTIREINLALFLTGDLCSPLCDDGFDERMDRLCESESQGAGGRRDWLMDRAWQTRSAENKGDQGC